MDEAANVPRTSSPPAVGTRRTQLAEERIYLAWLRSALAAFAVAVATGKVVPALTHVTRWPYLILGFGFCALGVLMAAYGIRRQLDVTRAIAAGTYVQSDRRVIAVLAGGTVALGVVLLVVLVTS